MYKIRNLAALTVLLLWGCATPPTIKDAEDIAPDARVVFGGVEVWSGDEQETWGVKFFGGNYFYLMMLPPDSTEATTYKLDKDGTFFWALEPGEYKLIGYHWANEGVQQTGNLDLTFVVAESGNDAYLGSIVFRNFGPYMLPAIDDQFDTAVAHFDARFPARRGTAIKQLLEPAAPIGDYANMRDECHKDWNIDCNKRFQGVTPIAPKVSSKGFPTVGSLQPEFRWKPCGKQGISYDFILYEAAAYALSGVTETLYMKGRVVAYEEGLAAAHWQPDSPLRPDTRYFWSVRMRDGDTVSHWSTQSHSTFLLVYMSWGSGQWFQFKTG